MVITKHIAVQSHHVNEYIFRSCSWNQQISDPRVLAEVMKQHYEGATNEQIMKYVAQHADVWLSLQSVGNLIKKLKRNGWTRDLANTGEAKPKRGKATAIKSSVKDPSGLESNNEDPDNTQTRRLRSAGQSSGRSC